MFTKTAKKWLAVLLAVACVLVGLPIALRAFGEGPEAAPVAAAQSAEREFGGALAPRRSRLEVARDAVRTGHVEQGIDDYKLAVEEEPGSTEAAVAELADVFVSASKSPWPPKSDSGQSTAG